MRSDSERSFVEARHPQRERGRDRFLASGFKTEIAQWVSQPSRVLVLGSGDGKEALALSGIFPQTLVVSMDLSGPEIQLAVQDSRLRGKMIRGDWDLPPFEPNSFDLVVFFAALHHSVDLTRTLRSVFKILRSGGVLYATHEPMSSALLGVFQRRRMARIAIEEEGIESSPSHYEYTRAISDAGFVSPRIFASGLNLVRLEDSDTTFEDVKVRRNPWPEKLVAKCMMWMRGRGPSKKLSFIFTIQRLAFGLFGVTMVGRKP